MKVQSGDVVLWGVRSIVNDDDRGRIQRLRESGAMVVLFASAAQSPGSTSIADAFIDSGPGRGLALDQFKICPTDSVINIINAWTWTGEFIGACTGREKCRSSTKATACPAAASGMRNTKARCFIPT